MYPLNLTVNQELLLFGWLPVVTTVVTTNGCTSLQDISLIWKYDNIDNNRTDITLLQFISYNVSILIAVPCLKYHITDI